MQVRPVHWVGFRDVAVVPRVPLPAPKWARFGPPKECRRQEAVDFDRGTAREITHKDTEVQFDDWDSAAPKLQNEGIDAVVGVGELHVFGMDFVLLDNADWDDLRPHELVERIHQNHYRPREVKPLREGQLPATFGFRTREQQMGILQLLPFDNVKPDVKMRYKLIELPGVQ